MVEKNDSCPICKKTGDKVKNITVKHMVCDELVEKVKDEDYYLCMNEECDVVYYNSDLDSVFKKADVKVPIWFKKDAEPKYVCYCNEVTEEQVISAVVKDNAENMKDIVRLTGAMKNGQCELKNPSGKCCHSVVQSAIDKGLQFKNKKN